MNHLEGKIQLRKGSNRAEFLIKTYEGSSVKTVGGENQPSPHMEEMLPYTESNIRETPFIDFMLPLDPPVRVSTVYAGRTGLLSERDNQMLLLTINSLKETYGMGTFAIDKVTAEVYSVKDDRVTPIDLQGYPEQEKRPLEGAVGFAPQSASTP